MTAKKQRPAFDIQESWLVVGATMMALLASGAFYVITLPTKPIGQGLFLTIPAVLLIALGLWGGQQPVSNRKPFIIAAIPIAVSLLSWALSPYKFQQFFYDVYGEMPYIVWLMYPLVFLIGSRLNIRAAEKGVRVVSLVGAGLILVAFFWRWVVGFVTVFGSPAYLTPALLFVPIMMAAIARTSSRRPYWLGGAVLMSVCLAYASGGLLGVFGIGAAVLALGALNPVLLGVPDKFERVARRTGVALFCLVILLVLLASVPSVYKDFVGTSVLEGQEQTVSSRYYLWSGAERMLADKPVLGWGPSGYRMGAVTYLEPGVFKSLGLIGSDPIAYSPPSPHSLMWEILVRLGVVGGIGFVTSAAMWLVEYRRRRAASLETENETSQTISDIQSAMAAAVLATCVVWMVTPVHFASALVIPLFAGMVMASTGIPERQSADDSARRAGQAAASTWLPITLGMILLVVASWLAYGQTVGQITGTDIIADQSRLAKSLSVVPGQPLYTRQQIDLEFIQAQNVDQISRVIERVQSAPAYIREYAPNYVRFAELGLAMSAKMGDSSHLSVYQEWIALADQSMPDSPALLGEKLHLALAEGDVEKVRKAYDDFMPQVGLYEVGRAYLAEADVLLASSGK